MNARSLHIAMLVTLGLSIFLLIALSVCEVIPLTNGNNDSIIQEQVDFQLARAEFLTKDVFALAYRPISGRAQATGELQIQLPAFQHTQAGLMNGDPTLGLPNNPSSGVKAALMDAQPDYLQIVTAIQIILGRPDSNPDPIQVNIVAGRERPYIASMYTVVTLLQQEAQTRVIQLLVLKMTLLGLVVILVLLKYLLFTQRVIKKMIDDEAIGDS
jgi:hypothetical protein